MSDRTVNCQLALCQIRELLGMPAGSSPYAIVCKVRETKAAADLAGEALKARGDRDGRESGLLARSIRVPL